MIFSLFEAILKPYKNTQFVYLHYFFSHFLFRHHLWGMCTQFFKFTFYVKTHTNLRISTTFTTFWFSCFISASISFLHACIKWTGLWFSKGLKWISRSRMSNATILTFPVSNFTSRNRLNDSGLCGAKTCGWKKNINRINFVKSILQKKNLKSISRKNIFFTFFCVK